MWIYEGEGRENLTRFMRKATLKKREFVAETALNLFIEKGFENVSVDEIIAATNTSKGTFYHYFDSKEEIIWEIAEKQNTVIDRWLSYPPSKVQSLESHINRLLIDLAVCVGDYPKLMRSMSALTLQNPVVYNDEHPFHRLYKGIMHWLPDTDKAQSIVTAYAGTLMLWCMQENADLTEMIKHQLSLMWSGLRAEDAVGRLEIEARPKEDQFMNVAIIGGGLAGLTAAAYISDCQFTNGVLFERSPQLGGRAFTYEKAGFTLNYGAHAIYGIDRHTISMLEQELGLSFSSKQVDKRQVMYAKHDKITPAPLDFVNLMRTEVLKPMQKMRFVGEISAIIAQIHQLKNYPTLGDYLAESNADDDVKELWEHLVCSNFFIAPEDARSVPGPVISEYYHNLFLSNRPVNYILGSWAVITNQLKQKIENSKRFEIALQESVESIRYEQKQYIIKTKHRELAFDRIVFAMPVQQVVKLLHNTPWEPFLAPYENNTATEVMVYDIGLKHVIAKPFHYISDMSNKMFISDVSATDHTLVPENGQLLQGIAYLSDNFENEEERKSYLEQKTKQMEQLFDRFYPGWQEAVAVKRVSKKAMVVSVKNVANNRLLPSRIESVPFFFCGDGCEGKGELAERSFFSAREVGRMIVKEAKKANRQANLS